MGRQNSSALMRDGVSCLLASVVMLLGVGVWWLNAHSFAQTEQSLYQAQEIRLDWQQVSQFALVASIDAHSEENNVAPSDELSHEEMLETQHAPDSDIDIPQPVLSELPENAPIEEAYQALPVAPAPSLPAQSVAPIEPTEQQTVIEDKPIVSESASSAAPAPLAKQERTKKKPKSKPKEKAKANNHAPKPSQTKSVAKSANKAVQQSSHQTANAPTSSAAQSMQTAKTMTAPVIGVAKGLPAAKEKSVSPAEFKAWEDSVGAAIARHRYYPRNAQRGGKQGLVFVSFTVLASGEIVQVQISQSSGIAELDNAALKAVKSVGRVKATPTGKPQSLSAPINFTLN